jgi:quinoprotein glucose dehydrogenase
VPQSTVPGEKTSRTQPFPLKPPPLAKNEFRKDEMYNLTADHAAFCNALFERNKMFTEGPFTPMPLEGNALLFPSTLGGGDWGGLSFDPTLGYIFANIMDLGQWGHMEKWKDPKTGETTYRRTSEMGPYARFWDPKTRIPCQNPPFGELVAVNANTGDIAWRVPLGTIDELEAKGIKNTGTMNMGGSIATAGGLIFIGATNDSRFRAFDSKTGKELWVEKIPTSAHSVPITYQAKNGKQYVVIMAGGAGYFGATPDDSLIAFALGQGPENPAAPVKFGQTLPAGNGRDVVQRMCGACHPVEIVMRERHDRSGWANVVHAMVARGATGTDQEIQEVIDYLAAHLGP